MNGSVKLEPSWLSLLSDLFREPWFLELKAKLVDERKRYTVYPPGAQMFAAMDLCPVDNTRVVILGQDPYHNPGRAHGLCFSVPDGVKPPPSLVNIFKELQSDLGLSPPAHGNLEAWARQGVLLLNTSLSVRANEAASHFPLGWERFTDAVISRLAQHKQNVVFLLWGRPARAKKKLIPEGRGHLVLEAAHPSPLSAYNGFFGCRHFSRTNEFLSAHGEQPIDWKLG